MARTKRHRGHGTWDVYEDGARIAGPLSREAAEAMVLQAPKAPVNDIDAERAYWRRVNADLGKPVSEDMAKLTAVIAASPSKYSEMEQASILRQFEAILKARGQSIRRTHNTILPAPVKAA